MSKSPERISEISVEFFERDERDISLRPRGTRISARIDYRERREAVPFDGIFGAHGIPVGTEGRGESPEWQWEWEGREQINLSKPTKGIKTCAKMRLFSFSYVTIMLLIGAVIQVWH